MKKENQEDDLKYQIFIQSKIIKYYEQLAELRDKQYMHDIKTMPIDQLYDLFNKDISICEKIKKFKNKIKK